MINLEAIQTKSQRVQVVGHVEFLKLDGSVYVMKNDGGETCGISFVFQGGKFSARLEPDVAKQLNVATEGQLVTYSRVVLEAHPATFGMEKRPGLRFGMIRHLETPQGVVYSVSEYVPQPSSTPKNPKEKVA